MSLRKKSSLTSLGEFGLIDLIKGQASLEKDVIKGIGDDAAVLPLDAKRYLLLTTDMLVEGVHFAPKENRRLIGQKALAVNISDIAAMGGVPKFAVVSLGVSKTMCLHAVKDIYKGINGLAKKFGVSVVGGDTVSSNKFVINIALTGEVAKRNLVLRSGAKKGDAIFVTGPLGRSLATKKHLNFIPRVKEAQLLVKSFRLHAMIDISDGLVADLSHILKQSGLGAIIEEERIPKTKGTSVSQALYDGEDFELVFTLSKKDVGRFCAQKKIKAYLIGEIVGKKKGLTLKDKKGKCTKIKTKGYQHF